jgi:hypothetical protein
MKPPNDFSSIPLVHSDSRNLVESKSIPNRARLPRNMEERRHDLNKMVRCSLSWTQPREILAEARDAARRALREIGGDLVTARKPHTNFSCVLSEWEVLRRVGVRLFEAEALQTVRQSAFEDMDDEELRAHESRPHPRYLRTLHPRWLIVFPACFQAAQRGPRWKSAFYIERETVWQAAGVLEDAWDLRQEFKSTTLDLGNFISLCMRIGEKCERLSSRQLAKTICCPAPGATEKVPGTTVKF